MGRVHSRVVLEAQLTDCISFQFTILQLVERKSTYSSTASRGPLVLRRGIGCEMFRTCLRTLPEGVNDEAIVKTLVWLCISVCLGEVQREQLVCT